MVRQLPILSNPSRTVAELPAPRIGRHAEEISISRRPTRFPTVALVPLGCSKAQIDAEEMLGALAANGYDIVADPKGADVVVVNTCGFIEPAKEESIETILDAATLKRTNGLRALVVTGCLAERYRDELVRELPEVDLVIPWSDQRELVARLDRHLGIDRGSAIGWGERTLISPRHWAYLRISEGCDHACSFCTIPSIRGRHVSVPPDALVDEMRRLIDRGVQEFNLVAQDTTLYGIDLFGKASLPSLLRRMAEVPGVRWLRLLYAHPAHVNDELIDVMANYERICPYLDLPIQHVNDVLLERMRRIVGRARIEALLARLRGRIRHITLRTSVIVGLPGETERRFQELVDFLPEAQFDRLGCFVYSKEEGTRAAAMRSQVPMHVREERRAVVMEVQRGISRARNRRRVGQEYDVLVDRTTRAAGRSSFRAEGRSVGEAPEVDGVIRLRAERPLAPGQWVRARIVRAGAYDLAGEVR